MSSDRSRTAYADSAADLARGALDALQGAGGPAMVAAHVEGAEDGAAALAAIRVVGADAFAPHLLNGTTFHPQDADTVVQSFTVFPLPETAPPAPPAGPAEPWVMAWRDWATAAMLARFAPGAGAGTVAPHVAQPAGAPVLAEGTALGADAGWAQWSVRMGQLSSLALPGLDGPVHTAARRAPLALARGASRAMLRRDYPMAARIVRWLALLQHEGVALPLDPAPLVGYLRVLGIGPRIALDVAIAGKLVGLEPV